LVAWFRWRGDRPAEPPPLLPLGRPAGEGWAVAASVEEGEGDEGFGLLNPKDMRGEEPQFGVGGLDEALDRRWSRAA